MSTPENFIGEALEYEAGAILGQMIATSPLASRVVEISDERFATALDYVRELLQVFHKHRQLIPFIFTNEDKTEMLGFALVLALPDEGVPAFLQRVMVKEPYRRQGIGSAILKSVLDSGRPIALVSPQDLTGFFAKQGVTAAGPVQQSEEPGFVLSRSFYRGGTLMVTTPGAAPIFKLTDNDIRALTERLGLAQSQTA